MERLEAVWSAPALAWPVMDLLIPRPRRTEQMGGWNRCYGRGARDFWKKTYRVVLSRALISAGTLPVVWIMYGSYSQIRVLPSRRVGLASSTSRGVSRR